MNACGSQAGSSASSCSEGNEKSSGLSSKSSSSPTAVPREPQPSTSQTLAFGESNNHVEEEPMDDNDSGSGGELVCAKCGGIRLAAADGSDTAAESVPSTSSSSEAVVPGNTGAGGGKSHNSTDLAHVLKDGVKGDLLTQGHTVSEEDFPSEDEEDKVPPSALCFGI